MPKKLVRSATAMRIAGLDRAKFNQAVSDGLYPCAPSASEGWRLFDEDDILGLMAFRILTDLGMLPRAAGPIACQVGEVARANKKSQRIQVVFGKSGLTQVHTAETFDPGKEQRKRLEAGSGAVLAHIEFHTATHRNIIRRAISEEPTIVGQSDPALDGRKSVPRT